MTFFCAAAIVTTVVLAWLYHWAILFASAFFLVGLVYWPWDWRRIVVDLESDSVTVQRVLFCFGCPDVYPLKDYRHGCADDWSHADIQLDVSGAPWQSNSRLRACVTGQSIHEATLQRGLIIIDFLSFPTELRLQLLPPAGEGDRPMFELEQSLSQSEYTHTEWATCNDCSPCETSLGTSGDSTLAIRLMDEN